MREHGRSRRRLNSKILNLLFGGGPAEYLKPKISSASGSGNTWRSNARGYDYRDVATLQ
jgi:hypothetical protein